MYSSFRLEGMPFVCVPDIAARSLLEEIKNENRKRHAFALVFKLPTIRC